MRCPPCASCVLLAALQDTICHSTNRNKVAVVIFHLNRMDGLRTTQMGCTSCGRHETFGRYLEVRYIDFNPHRITLVCAKNIAGMNLSGERCSGFNQGSCATTVRSGLCSSTFIPMRSMREPGQCAPTKPPLRDGSG